jgi:hypothetical protein
MTLIAKKKNPLKGNGFALCSGLAMLTVMA